MIIYRRFKGPVRPGPAMGVAVVFDPVVEQEFHNFAREIRTDPLMVLLAKWRRSHFVDALKNRPDVVEIIPSGSLARGTHVGRIHDIDLIVVFKEDMHPDWKGSGSARPSLEHLQGMIGETLQGGPLSLVHDTELRNHVVKCNLDPSWGPFDFIIPGAPPVDVMPAVREGSHLRIPERLSDGWIQTDPERLMSMVAARQRQWSNFDQVVRMIKDWGLHSGLKLRGPTVEALVLEYLPQPGLFETLSCSDAVARFFEEASRAHITKLVDPAGRCGEIDPRLDYGGLMRALDRSADLARKAVAAERAWENRDSSPEGVIHPSVYWRDIFGKDRFRRPRVWYWSPQFPDARPSFESRRWFDKQAEPVHESRWGWRHDASAPRTPDGREGTDGPGTRGEPWSPAEPGDLLKPVKPIPGGREPDSLDTALRPSTQDVPITPSRFG